MTEFLANRMWLEMIYPISWPINTPKLNSISVLTCQEKRNKRFQEPIYMKSECVYPLGRKSHFKEAILQKQWHMHTHRVIYMDIRCSIAYYRKLETIRIISIRKKLNSGIFILYNAMQSLNEKISKTNC